MALKFLALLILLVGLGLSGWASHALLAKGDALGAGSAFIVFILIAAHIIAGCVMVGAFLERDDKS
jgi:hypothetical protein